MDVGKIINTFIAQLNHRKRVTRNMPMLAVWSNPSDGVKNIKMFDAVKLAECITVITNILLPDDTLNID